MGEIPPQLRDGGDAGRRCRRACRVGQAQQHGASVVALSLSGGRACQCQCRGHEQLGCVAFQCVTDFEMHFELPFHFFKY